MKPPKKNKVITVRMNSDEHAELVRRARLNGRSMNEACMTLIRLMLEGKLYFVTGTTPEKLLKVLPKSHDDRPILDLIEQQPVDLLDQQSFVDHALETICGT